MAAGRRRFLVAFGALAAAAASARLALVSRPGDPKWKDTPANRGEFAAALESGKLPRPKGALNLTWQYADARTRDLVAPDGANLFLPKRRGSGASVELRAAFAENPAHYDGPPKLNRFTPGQGWRKTSVSAESAEGRLAVSRGQDGSLRVEAPEGMGFGFIVERVLMSEDGSVEVKVKLLEIDPAIVAKIQDEKDQNSAETWEAAGLGVAALFMFNVAGDMHRKYREWIETDEGRSYVESVCLRKASKDAGSAAPKGKSPSI